MDELLREIRTCKVCLPHLEHGVNPVMAAHTESRIAIIGQAPGKAVHQSGIAWDDPSGERLRDWLGVDKPSFYDPKLFALVPMGFCYPGKGKSGDLPPRPECAPLWHEKLFDAMPNLQLRILVGSYSQAHYLGDRLQKNLTETIRDFSAYLPGYLPLPHPSPRNNIWLKKNPWFEKELLPVLRTRVAHLCSP